MPRLGVDGLMPADRHDWLEAAAKRTFRTSDADAVVIAAVERSEMDSEYDLLDDLLA